MSKSNGRDLSHHDSGCCDRQNPLAIHSKPITTERLLVGFWVFLPTHRALFHQSIVFHIIHEIGLGLNALARIGAYIIDLSLPK